MAGRSINVPEPSRHEGWKLERKTTPSWCFKEEDCSTLWITRRVEVYCEGWLEIAACRSGRRVSQGVGGVGKGSGTGAATAATTGPEKKSVRQTRRLLHSTARNTVFRKAPGDGIAGPGPLSLGERESTGSR